MVTAVLDSMDDSRHAALRCAAGVPARPPHGGPACCAADRTVMRPGNTVSPAAPAAAEQLPAAAAGDNIQLRYQTLRTSAPLPSGSTRLDVVLVAAAGLAGGPALVCKCDPEGRAVDMSEPEAKIAVAYLQHLLAGTPSR